MLASGPYIDSDAPGVRQFTEEALAGRGASPTERAVALFEAVRDRIRYDPYSIPFDPEAYRASAVAAQEAAFCVPKAILLTACLRAAGIPALVGFADVRNHLNTPRLASLMGTDLFIYHGYVQLQLGERAFKVTPAFNSSLCARFGVRPLTFDGTADALFHEYDAHDRRHMEYVRDRGTFDEPPIEEMLAAFRSTYPLLGELATRRSAQVADAAFAAPASTTEGIPT